MKLATLFMTVAAGFVFAASHQAHAGPSSAEQETALLAADSPAVLVAQARVPSPRGYQVHEPMHAEPRKRGPRAIAQPGPEAPRRYVDRTRVIYALDYRDFATF